MTDPGTNTAATVFVLCYGNPGRLDDGLGPALGAALEGDSPPGVTVDVDYQLTVEDAVPAGEHDVVVFVDAAVRGAEPFAFHPVEPAPTPGVRFSSHGAEPEEILALARELTGRTPQGYALAIRGYTFDDFGEGLSPAAKRNLEAALGFLRRVLADKNFAAASAALGHATLQDAALLTEN